MSFDRYLDIVSGNFKKAVKVEWLNPDETVAFEFTNSLYDINVDLSVNYQNGSRRTCTLILNNDRNQFPINFNSIWFGQKFKLWMGIYIDEKTPYYFPQGVFYISNPNDVYQPASRTIKINGVDKWAYLDGTLHGKLSGIYQTNIGVNLYDATRDLLKQPTGWATLVTVGNINSYFDIAHDKDPNNPSYYFNFKDSTETAPAEFIPNNGVGGSKYYETTAVTRLIAKKDMLVSFKYKVCFNNKSDTAKIKIGDKVIIEDDNNLNSTETYSCKGAIKRGQEVYLSHYKGTSYSDNAATASPVTIFDIKVDTNHIPLDSIEPFISPYFLTKTAYVLNSDSARDSKKTYYKYDKNTGEYVEYTENSWGSDYSTLYYETEVWKCPYTAKVERGKTYADVLLEYATILCAHVYYDVNGRLVIEPMIDTADDITDTDKEVMWNFTVEEKALLGLSQTYNFDKVYNDIIVLGNIVNGYQFKARVQNQNPLSDTCIQKIGLKTKEPLEDNQYYSDDQCKELAMYHAKVDTIMQKGGSINSTPLYHLDVNKLVSVSTPNNNMSKELFLVSGYTLNSSNSMSINIASVNILKDFSVVEVDVYE